MAPEKLLQELRSKLLEIADATLAAVDPAAPVRTELRLRDDVIESGDIQSPFNLPATKIAVAAIGKAALPMARAARDVLGDRIHDGIIVLRDPGGDPPPGFALHRGNHPQPGLDSIAACEQVEAFIAKNAAEDCSFLLLLSGGASSLVAAPMSGITPEEMAGANQWLLDSGHNIRIVNLLRRKITRLGAGGFLLATGGRPTLTLALSDVVHGGPEDIGSGPTLPDPASNETAMRILGKDWKATGFPEAVYEYLRKGRDKELPEKPDRNHPCFKNGCFVILRDNLFARKFAKNISRKLGCADVHDAGLIAGEAFDFGRRVARVMERLIARDIPAAHPLALVAGGESQVTIEGRAGQGGRNLELALSLALECKDRVTAPYVALALGTDGSDGTSSAAGAFVDSSTLDRAAEAGLDPRVFLEAHDTHNFFAPLGDLRITGPTGTNVADLLLILIDSPAK